MRTTKKIILNKKKKKYPEIPFDILSPFSQQHFLWSDRMASCQLHSYNTTVNCQWTSAKIVLALRYSEPPIY
jgi:hypothetical protein